MRQHLDQLLAGVVAAPDVLVQGLTLDSRRVVPDGIFVALPGLKTHGLAFARQAQQQGARAILFEPPVPADISVPENAIAVPGLRAQLGVIADRFFAHPSQSLWLVGVTGTNGKTSTVQLLAQALTYQGQKAGSIGTLGVGLHGAVQAGERTTPDVISVHAALNQLREAGAEAVAMEVSSHALDQGRVDAVRFDVAVFTNLTRDHLDYHGDMAAYGAAKARLFAWEGLNAAVINLDDAFGSQLASECATQVDVLGTSRQGHPLARVRADSIELTQDGVCFDLMIHAQRTRVQSRLLGQFNVDNLLAVAGVLSAKGWSLETIAATLAQLEPVAGRMNRLDGHASHPLVVVDYAHTPDALEQALESLRGHTRGRLFCVFGCGGNRDTGKRPQMAAVAERLADQVIVTDDNPRHESGDRIIADILVGFSRPDRVDVERDRHAAIALAIHRAQPGDTVLIAGKGHETTQDVSGVAHPFDDRLVARHCLEARV